MVKTRDGNEMESNRKACNKRQTKLRDMMMSFDQHPTAIELFLKQHAMLHTAKMAQTDAWSFEDEVLNDMTEEQIRRIPQNYEHSVAWLIWHIARIEDVAMNMLAAGEQQVLFRDDWLKVMGIPARDTGNAMSIESVTDLSETIEIEALRAYRATVGRRTREIVIQLKPEELKHKVDPSRLQTVIDEGAVVEEANWLIDYWGKRNIAGLLLMPATRHIIVHLNEALRIKRRRQ